MRYFFLYQPNSSAPSIDEQVIAQRAKFSANTVITTIPSLPPLQGVQEAASRFPEENQATLIRYWQTQDKNFTEEIAALYSKVFSDEIQEVGFFVLSGVWNNFQPNTVCFKMQSNTLGLFIVFDQLTINNEGQILTDGKVADLDAQPSAVSTMPLKEGLGDTSNNLANSTLSILNYIGAGLAADGFPIVGTVLQALFSLLSEWLSPESDVSEVIDEIEQLLEQNKIQTEIDFAKATIETWQGWEGLYFNQSDFELLSNSNADKTSQAYKDALSNATKFITNAHTDFTTTSRLFDAVNLMKGDTGINSSSNLDQPTDAMYKFPPFLLFSSYVLAFGKQAWIYSFQVNGKDDPNTRDLAHAVVTYSSQYTDYVNQISAAIQQQVSQRTGYISVTDNTGQAVWMLVDNYDDAPFDWKKAGYNGPGNFNYCGNSQAQKAQQDAYNAQNQLISDLTNYIYTQINAAGMNDLLTKIQTFKDNNNKLQNLNTL
jgi:hypothetical protein